MGKHYDWVEVFDYFNRHSKIKTTFATKYPTMFLSRNYNLYWNKHRIRVSLMPQKYSDVLEPGTDKISTRIAEIPKLQEVMEVHINFSPIIYTDGWIEELKAAGVNVKCECIFLTHNIHQHERNSQPVRDLLWRPDIQETKDSQYAADNIRYRHDLKRMMVSQFSKLYSEYFNPENIRYIF
jgi:hypothetical protein